MLRAVLELMGDNAFAERPPKFIRASLYQYHFTSSDNNDDRSVLRTASKSSVLVTLLAECSAAITSRYLLQTRSSGVRSTDRQTDGQTDGRRAVSQCSAVDVLRSEQSHCCTAAVCLCTVHRSQSSTKLGSVSLGLFCSSQ